MNIKFVINDMEESYKNTLLITKRLYYIFKTLNLENEKDEQKNILSGLILELIDHIKAENQNSFAFDTIS